MIQDIKPHVFHNEFQHKRPSESSCLCAYKDGAVLLSRNSDTILLPRFQDLKMDRNLIASNGRFLFTVDQNDYFLLQNQEVLEDERWEYVPMQKVRYMKPMWQVFVCALGDQLNRWFECNRFCGRCGASLTVDTAERAFVCSSCGRIIYPTLSPSVIVAVTDQDRLLLTRYAARQYKNYALVAGYTEIGETLEQCAEREVMEEVGLKVKNLRYYKSQPWPFTSSLLVGYFAELDGDDHITLQESELSEAVWVKREDIRIDGSMSLTNEMIRLFQRGFNPKAG